MQHRPTKAEPRIPTYSKLFESCATSSLQSARRESRNSEKGIVFSFVLCVSLSIFYHGVEIISIVKLKITCAENAGTRSGSFLAKKDAVRRAPKNFLMKINQYRQIRSVQLGRSFPSFAQTSFDRHIYFMPESSSCPRVLGVTF